MNIIFDKETRRVTGTERFPSPFEFVVKGVPSGLNKEVFETQPLIDEEVNEIGEETVGSYWVTLESDPTAFTYSEVTAHLIAKLKEQTGCSHTFGNSFLLDEAFMPLDPDSGSIADFGVKFASIPAGCHIEATYTLEEPTDTLHVSRIVASSDAVFTINGIEPVDGIVLLDDATDSVTVRFENTTERRLIVEAFTVCYGEG